MSDSLRLFHGLKDDGVHVGAYPHLVPHVVLPYPGYYFLGKPPGLHGQLFRIGGQLPAGWVDVGVPPFPEKLPEDLRRPAGAVFFGGENLQRLRGHGGHGHRVSELGRQLRAVSLLPEPAVCPAVLSQGNDTEVLYVVVHLIPVHVIDGVDLVPGLRGPFDVFRQEGPGHQPMDLPEPGPVGVEIRPGGIRVEESSVGGQSDVKIAARVGRRLQLEVLYGLNAAPVHAALQAPYSAGLIHAVAGESDWS